MKFTVFSFALTIFSALSFSSINLSAESKIVVKIPAANQVASADIAAGSSSDTSVIFYYLSKGNITSQVGVEVLGPKGLDAVVEAAQIKGSVQATLDKGNFWKIPIEGTLTKSGKTAALNVDTESIPKKSSVMLRSANPICDYLPTQIVDAIVASLSAEEGRKITRGDYCSGSYMPSGSNSNQNPDSSDGGGEIDIPLDPIPTGSNQNSNQPSIDQRYASAKGVLQKDNCGKIKSYLVRLTVKLKNVAAEDLAAGFKIESRIQEAEYNGSRAASLKPVSDGMYAPRPLLLMQSLGGSQTVSVVRWTKGKPKTVTKASASPSIVYYRGFILVRVVADRLLAGGRGERVNFELSNGYSLYNVCGKRARVRWRINGYPGGD